MGELANLPHQFIGFGRGTVGICIPAVLRRSIGGVEPGQAVILNAADDHGQKTITITWGERREDASPEN